MTTDQMAPCFSGTQLLGHTLYREKEKGWKKTQNQVPIFRVSDHVSDLSSSWIVFQLLVICHADGSLSHHADSQNAPPHLP